MSKEIPRYRIAVYTPDQRLPSLVPSIEAFGDLINCRIEDIKEAVHECQCFFCGDIVAGTGDDVIAELLRVHYGKCEKNPLTIENRWLQTEADELRKVLWWYAELHVEDCGRDIGDRAIEALQRFPGDKKKKIVFEGVQPK